MSRTVGTQLKKGNEEESDLMTVQPFSSEFFAAA
jgi:hypothetical protein